MSILPNVRSTDDAKDEIDGMKNDIKSIISRMGNIKDNAGDIMSEQLDDLSEAISNIKNKGIRKGEGSLAEICDSTRKNPARNLAYAFGVGILFAWLVK